MDRLRALIERWREKATATTQWMNNPDALPVPVHSADVRMALNWCADELEAALAAEPTCQHGKALDVHCCGCHSGFLFDPSTCVCLGGLDDV